MITLSLLHPLHKNPIQNWTFEEKDVIRIGRSTDNDVVLYSAVVSRYHLEIRKGVVGWAIQSLGTNGTYLDGKRIKNVTAEDGLVVRLAGSGPKLQVAIGEPGGWPDENKASAHPVSPSELTWTSLKQTFAIRHHLRERPTLRIR